MKRGLRRPPLRKGGAAAGLTGLLLMAVVLSSPARAIYPGPVERFVSDYAQLLTAAEAAELREILAGLEDQTGVEMTVAVIKSYRDFGSGDASVEEFATNPFNS